MKKLFLNLLAVFALSASAQNPYLPLWEHLPDGEPRVFEDPDNPGKYRAYIIGSHDTHYTEYCGNDIRMWSAPVEDLSQWRDEGPIFKYFIDGHLGHNVCSRPRGSKRSRNRQTHLLSLSSFKRLEKSADGL